MLPPYCVVCALSELKAGEMINAVGGELLGLVGGLVQPNGGIRLLNEERPLPDDEGDVPGLEVRDEEGGRQTP